MPLYWNIKLILLIVVHICALEALLASLGPWLVAATAQYAIGAFVAALVVGIEMLITGILGSTVFWVAMSTYGLYTASNRIKEAKNNPNLTRKDAAFEYGYGTAEIILSFIPFWGKFKGRTKGENSKTIPNSTTTPKSKTNYENHGGEFNDDFSRMGTQQEPLMNKPPGTNKSVHQVDDIAKKIDLMGGRKGTEGYTNYDIQAQSGIADNVKNIAKYFPENSIDEFMVNNPQDEFIQYILPLLRKGGIVRIRGQFSNKYFSKIWDANELDGLTELSRTRSIANQNFKKTNLEPIKGNVNELILMKK